MRLGQDTSLIIGGGPQSQKLLGYRAESAAPIGSLLPN